jgi:hypothetical protein
MPEAVDVPFGIETVASRFLSSFCATLCVVAFGLWFLDGQWVARPKRSCGVAVAFSLGCWQQCWPTWISWLGLLSFVAFGTVFVVVGRGQPVRWMIHFLFKRFPALTTPIHGLSSAVAGTLRPHLPRDLFFTVLEYRCLNPTWRPLHMVFDRFDEWTSDRFLDIRNSHRVPVTAGWLAFAKRWNRFWHDDLWVGGRVRIGVSVSNAAGAGPLVLAMPLLSIDDPPENDVVRREQEARGKLPDTGKWPCDSAAEDPGGYLFHIATTSWALRMHPSSTNLDINLGHLQRLCESLGLPMQPPSEMPLLPSQRRTFSPYSVDSRRTHHTVRLLRVWFQAHGGWPTPRLDLEFLGYVSWPDCCHQPPPSAVAVSD